MKVTFRETNYKTVEVPEGTTTEELEKMVQNGDVIVGDTTETEYAVRYENKKAWYGIC